MVNQKQGIIAVLLLAFGIAAFLFFSQSDEAKIKKRFHQLAEKIEKKGAEHDLIAAKAAHAVAQIFSQTVHLQIPSYSVDKTFSRKDIAPHVLHARTLYTEMTLHFHDFQIEFPAKETAKVQVTAIFEAALASGEAVNGIHEIACTLEKTDDEWVFTGIQEIEVLER